MINIIGIFITAASIVGVVLNIKKMRACFFIWLFTNSAWMIIDAVQGLWSQSILFAVYVCLAAWGIYSWKEKTVHGKYNGLCDKCGTAIEWEGEFIDKPACPGCGKQIDKKILAECEKNLEAAAKKQVEQQLHQTQKPQRPIVGRGKNKNQN